MYQDKYKRWVSSAVEDGDLQDELQTIASDAPAIEDRFGRDLAFGTAGLRGVIGAGTNRMNIYTVRKATQGLANYLKQNNSAPSVALAYDSRIKSELFSREAARVLAANGILVYLYPVLQPVPLLSFAVRHLGASAGIMVTASHNPAKYNGYKAYGPDGCQMTTQAADAVYAEIQSLDIFDDIRLMPFEQAVKQKIISYIPDSVPDSYQEEVLAQAIRPKLCHSAGLKIVYSPLNGAGNVPVRRILQTIGISDVTVVPEQELPDGNFPTCPFPNPEIRETLQKGLDLAQAIGADLMLATDPDADRVGIAVRDNGGQYHLLSGNEVGVLLLDYIAKGRKEQGTLHQNPIAVKSFVSTPMADDVAKKNGIELVTVLTGFKFIGEVILNLEKKQQQDRFILGFEESYGYLAGTYVRDKDAVVASMLISEMAAYHKTQGSSLYEALQALYDEYGYYINMVDSFDFDGLSGMQKMQDIMAKLRQNPPPEIAGIGVQKWADYSTQTIRDAGGHTSKLDLPPADVLQYTLDGGMSVMVRPSGTEPKIKVYYATKAPTKTEAQNLQRRLATVMQPLITG